MKRSQGLTSLHGNQMTEKDNPMIIFRGKLDTLCAMILEAQALGKERGNTAFVTDLQEILEFARTLLRAEYSGSPVGDFSLLGISGADMRERSHHPEKYFGRGHLLMHHSMGALSIRLNSLRTFAREVEIAAVAALRDKDDPSVCRGEPSAQGVPVRVCRREDITEALNRLSSLFYILIYKYLPEDYSSAGDAGI